MSYLLSVFTGLKYLSRHFDDDPTDQLHYRFTSNTLICLAIVVSFKQFGGKPIECMMPDHLHGPWEQFVENYCWAQDTYYLSFDQDLTRADELRNAKIGYYQWVPFFLLLSALSFQIPTQVWRFVSTSSGIRLESLVEQAIDPKNIVMESRQHAIRTVAIHLENALKFQRRLHKRRMVPHKVLRFLNLPYKAFFMTFMYLMVKCLYVVNVFAQFLLMNFFLQTGSGSTDRWYGWSTLRQLISGTQWSTSGFFPRVTLCDFYIRVPGTVQRHSIQCVLSINLFNEKKIFIFLWFWYHILAVVTVGSLVYWLVVCSLPCFQRWFVVRHLELADMPFDPVESEQAVQRFVHHYLRTDGVFVLRMVNMQTGVIFSSELIAALYKSHEGIEGLVKSGGASSSLLGTIGSGAGASKKWPPIEKIQKMVEEQIHPPPTEGGLDMPDTELKTAMVLFELDNRGDSTDETSKLFGAIVPRLDDRDEFEDAENGSPYSAAASRRRHVGSSEKT